MANISKVGARRLITHGNYANTAVEIEATLHEDDNAEVILKELVSWCDARLAEIVGRKDEAYEIDQQMYTQRAALSRLNERIERAKAAYVQVKAVLATHGIPVEELPVMDDVPF
jgi:hypothetical protein